MRAFLCALLAIFASLLYGDIAHALTTCDPSQQVRIIFVRGSGEEIDGITQENIKKSLENNLTSVNYKYYELKKSIDTEGTADIDEYRAIGVVGDVSNIRNGLEAILTSSQLGEYRKSVDTGKKLLKSHLQAIRGSGSCVVLIGYSQGAQVVGEVLKDNQDIRDNIIYVGLIGDPKFDTQGYSLIPGVNVPWYRGTAIVGLQGGILGARWPDYIPQDTSVSKQMFTSASSWCYITDPVCSSNMAAFSLNEHMKYDIDAIPNMALEIANAINNPTGVVDKNLRTPDYCTTNKKQDIVMLVDTSPFMRRNQALFTDTTLYNYNPRQAKTAGQQIVDSGCGDTRVAVVGYAGPGEDPRLLLDFTSTASDYDALMKSLYQPSDTGTYGRTQLREGAIMASQVNWREDAMKTVFTLTNVTGSGPTTTWRGWSENYQKYLSDVKTQELIEKFRAKNIVMLGMQVPSDFTGYTLAPNEDTNSTYDANGYLLKSIINATGGYSWIRQYNYYDPYTFKKTFLDLTLNDSFKMRSSIDASVPSFRGEVGKQLTLDLQDNLHYLAAAKLRGDEVGFTWYADCSDNAISRLYDIRQRVLFTPTKAGKCKGAVHITLKRNTSNGCYFSCPEPFPPYAFRSIPFDIDVKPAGYVAKVPGPVTSIDKTIYDDSVVYTWDEPAYYGSEPLVYLVKDQDGSIVAATRTRKLTITDTNKTDPFVSITPLGEDGRAEPAASNDDFVDIHDMRTPDQTSEPVSDPPTSTPVAHNNPTIPPNPSHSPAHVMAAVLGPHPITLGESTLPTTSTFYSDPTMDGDSYGTNVLGEAVTPTKANAKHIYTHAATVTAKPNSTFSLLAVPLSVALTLGVLVAAAVYIRIR